MRAKDYLQSWLRLHDQGQAGRMLSPESKLFRKDLNENSDIYRDDNISSWLIKKALDELQTCEDCKHCKKVPFDYRCGLNETKRVYPMSTKKCEKFEPKEVI